MTSISVFPGFGWRNAGDLAINQGTITFLNKVAPESTPELISIHSSSSEDFDKTKTLLSNNKRRYNFIEGPISYDPKNQSNVEQMYYLSKDAIRYGSDLVNASKISNHFGTNMAKTIKRSDLLLFNGGNVIHNNRNIAYLLGILYPMQIANKYNIPYGILPHTIFDIEGLYQSYIKKLLEGAEFIWTRDDISYEYLSNEKRINDSIYKGIDTAFFLEDGYYKEYNRGEGIDIGAVPRFTTLGDTGHIDADDDKDMEQMFLDSILSLSNRGYNVTIVVQTKEEREWVEKNQMFLNENKISIYESYDPQSLRKFYSNIGVLITMRLHAGIFALSVGTPALGIYREEWGPKTPGTWKALDIDEYAFCWRDLNSELLCDKSEEMLSNRCNLSNNILDSVTKRKEEMLTVANQLFSN